MSTTMLYKCPGPHEIHGGRFDYVIVPDVEIEAKLAEGWSKTTAEAKTAHEESQKPKAESKIPSDAEPPTRSELEAKATELGLKFDGRTTDKKLGELIEAKLAEPTA